MRPWIAAAGAIAATACADEATVGTVAIRSDSAGIEFVENSPETRSLAWEFEPLLTLGGADDGPESFFSVPRAGVAFGPAGQIVVLDAGNSHVQVFNGSGAFIRSVGRDGGGPGEFQFPASLSVDPAGTITVRDFGHRALIHFDSSGTYRDQTPAPAAAFGPIRGDDGAYVFVTRRSDPVSGGFNLHLHRATDQDTIELAHVPIAEPKSIMYESCGVSMSLPPLFADPPSWDARAGRIVLSGAPEYLVRVFDEGREVRRIRRPNSPQAATPEQAVRELGDGEEWSIGGRACTVPPEEVVEQRGIAESIPAIAGVAVAPDGSVWVQREVIGEELGPVDVFDGEGEYVSTLPPTTPWPLSFSGSDRILTLETDALGVQRVVVYAIQRN